MPVVLVVSSIAFAAALSLRNADPLLPLLSAELRRDPRELALVGTAFTLPYAIMQLFLGPWGDTVGKERVVRLCLAAMALSAAASAMATSFGQLLAARAALGAAAGGIVPVALALVADRVPMENRQVAMSRVMLGSLSGQLFGAAGAGFLGPLVGWRAVFAGTAFIMAVATIVAHRSLPLTSATGNFSVTGSFARYRGILAQPRARALYAAVFLEGLLAFSLFPFVVILFESRGSGGVQEAGLTIMAFALGGVAYTTMVSFLLRRLGQRWMILAGGLVSGTSVVATSLFVHWSMTAILFGLAGYGFMMLHNSLQTEASEIAPQSRGAAVALFAFLFFAGQGLGIVLIGSALLWIPLPHVIAIAGAGLVAVAIFVALKVSRT